MTNMGIEITILFMTLAITTGAQIYINKWYSKTKKIKNKKEMNGAEVARLILDKNGLSNVKVEETSGILSDHYDPRTKVVRLSPDIYNNPTIASISVASHECGHAIQDKNNYAFLRLRNNIVPVVNFASYAGYIAIVIGIFASALNFIWIGIAMEMIILIFQLITLPVEFNASSRALKQLNELNVLEKTELKQSKKMLTAAAMTYVAAVATAVLEIIRLILIFGGRDE